MCGEETQLHSGPGTGTHYLTHTTQEISAEPENRHQERRSQCSGKCYKAYREEFSWFELSQDYPNYSNLTQACPDDSRAAIVDSIPRSSAVESALRVAGLKNCWVYAKQWEPAVSSSTASWWFSSKNDVQPFRVEDNVDNECLNNELLGSCLYTNENGKGCNDNCDTKRCFVCEINAETSIQATTSATTEETSIQSIT